MTVRTVTANIVVVPQVTGLTATPASSTQINLAWNVVSGATYRVYRNGALVATPTSASYADTGRAPSTQYTYTVSAVVNGIEGPQSAQQSATTQAGGSSVYTPTHFVAPFASVTGATNDYADLGATAWANAANSGTPTTLGTAMARATAGNRVRVAEGVYTGTTTASRWIPSFGAANSGTAGNPIVFFAANPAATVYGNTSLYSEIRKPGEVNPGLGPLSGRNYIIFDGFYANEALCRSAPAAGVFQIGSSTGTQYRRCAFDRGGVAYPAGFNGNLIYLEATINSRITDCYFTGLLPIGGNIHNDSCVEIYNSANYLVEHCTFTNVRTTVYPKENDAGGAYVTSGTIRYCRMANVTRGIEVQQGVTTEIHNNLTYSLNSTLDWGLLLDSGPDRAGVLDFNIHHNTIVVNGANTAFGIETGCDIATSEFRDNLIYATSDHSRQFIACEGVATAWDWTDWTLNYNCYHAVSGTYNFRSTNNSIVSGLTNWRTATGGEANSIISNPLFVNAAANDYRLSQSGQAALTASSTGGPVGCYITGNEEIGVRANPAY